MPPPALFLLFYYFFLASSLDGYALISIVSSSSIWSYLLMKVSSLCVLSASNFYQTASLSFVNRSSPRSLKASVPWNKDSKVSYLFLIFSFVSSDWYCFMPMQRFTRMPMIGAKYYSNVAEWEYTLSVKYKICLSTSPMKTEFRVNIIKLRRREEWTWSTSKKSSGHQVAKSSHMRSKSIEVSKYDFVFLRAMPL